MAEDYKKHKKCSLEYEGRYCLWAWCVDHEVEVNLPNEDFDFERGSQFEDTLRGLEN